MASGRGVKRRDEILSQKLTDLHTRMNGNIVMVEYPPFFFWHTTFSVAVFESKLCVRMIFEYSGHQLSTGQSFVGQKAHRTTQIQCSCPHMK